MTPLPIIVMPAKVIFTDLRQRTGIQKILLMFINEFVFVDFSD
jgi:hypothetical protein